MTTFLDSLGITPADPSRTDRPGDDAGLSVTPTEEHVNVNGGVHGGLIATLLDAVMGRAVRADLPEGKTSVTVSMTVSYISPARIGTALRASAEVRKRGASLCTVEGDVVADEDREPVAHGVATYALVDSPDHGD